LKSLHYTVASSLTISVTRQRIKANVLTYVSVPSKKKRWLWVVSLWKRAYRSQRPQTLPSYAGPSVNQSLSEIWGACPSVQSDMQTRCQFSSLLALTSLMNNESGRYSNKNNFIEDALTLILTACGLKDPFYFERK
jgi:hypothetical protein